MIRSFVSASLGILLRVVKALRSSALGLFTILAAIRAALTTVFAMDVAVVNLAHVDRHYYTAGDVVRLQLKRLSPRTWGEVLNRAVKLTKNALTAD